jgi:hypothetical protein
MSGGAAKSDIIKTVMFVPSLDRNRQALRRFRPPTEKRAKPAHHPLSHRPLLLASKGLIHRHWQVFRDFLDLIGSAKKEQSKSSFEFVNLDEIVMDRHCDIVAIFETRHRRVNSECYFWIVQVPEGPTELAEVGPRADLLPNFVLAGR